MKVDPVVSNNDELYITNQSQQNKIVYLQSCKTKQQQYIRDMQQSLLFNKQSISMLTTALAQPAQSKNQKQGSKPSSNSNGSKQSLQKIIARLNEQNINLIKQTKIYYNELMSVNALVLIEQQLRFEEKKFYAERIQDFQNNMNELRKYLQDKQESFSTVVTRLKKYEDINESPLETKLHKLASQLGEEHAGALLKKLAEERDKYRNVWEKFHVSVDELAFLKGCLDSKQSYQSMLSAYSKYRQHIKQEKHPSFSQPTKNTTSNISFPSPSSTYSKPSSSKAQNPNRELIKLLKKQKLNNDILQEALNEAIQKNQQLILHNNTLVEANVTLQMKLEKVSAKCCIMEAELGRIQGWRIGGANNTKKGHIDARSQGGFRKKQKEFYVRGDEHQLCLLGMKEDMERLSSFILTCVPKSHLVKSSSNPNLVRRNEDVIEQGDDIQIEQL